MTRNPTFKHVPDPLIDEVRAVRKELSDRFGNDVVRLGDHLRKVEAQHEARRKAAVPDAESNTG